MGDCNECNTVELGSDCVCVGDATMGGCVMAETLVETGAVADVDSGPNSATSSASCDCDCRCCGCECILVSVGEFALLEAY